MYTLITCKLHVDTFIHTHTHTHTHTSKHTHPFGYYVLVTKFSSGFAGLKSKLAATFMMSKSDISFCKVHQSNSIDKVRYNNIEKLLTIDSFVIM